ncbi:MAG: FHA domain-containing protein [Gammaproteobacteria bacterium]|nr:FHA domain-containing protein [Gammaproteobacteria bacterium]
MYAKKQQTTDIPTMSDDKNNNSAKVILSRDGQVLGDFDLNKRNLMIGRREDCDIRIDSKNVSRLHAQIFTVLDQAYVLDLDSKNGTFVNSRRVKKHLLSDGDVVTLGGHELRYVFPEEED